MSEKRREFEKKLIDSTRIEILLKEYELCHQNRDHYDKIGWQIGSIFIALSLATLWIALDVWTNKNKIVPTPYFLVPLGVFSFFSIATWILYSYRVRPFILASLNRCQMIENIFRQLDLDLGEQLHSKIRRYDNNCSKMKDEYHRRWRYGGLGCLCFFFFWLVVAWVFLIFWLVITRWG